MHRITIAVEKELAAELDREVSERSYASRSEAVRDLVREGLEMWRNEHHPGALCIANLSYIFDGRVRQLGKRLAQLQHVNHDLVHSCTTVRLDHHSSFESVVLKGKTEAVQGFADQVRAERGVKFAKLNLLQVDRSDNQHGPEDHSHDAGEHLSPVG